MQAMKRITLLIVLIALVLLAGSAHAMESASYRLDWFTPLIGGGGGAASSASYAINLTIGQTAIGTQTSAGYEGCLGYWCGTEVEHAIYLPLVLRSHT
jgi:hypothetical protein